MKRPLLAGLAILIAWMLLDLLMHRLFLAPLYEASTELWRPFDQMNVALIYTVTIVLISVVVGIYGLLVRPKSLGTGLALGPSSASLSVCRQAWARSFTCRFRLPWHGAGLSVVG